MRCVFCPAHNLHVCGFALQYPLSGPFLETAILFYTPKPQKYTVFLAGLGCLPLHIHTLTTFVKNCPYKLVLPFFPHFLNLDSPLVCVPFFLPHVSPVSGSANLHSKDSPTLKTTLSGLRPITANSSMQYVAIRSIPWMLWNSWAVRSSRHLPLNTQDIGRGAASFEIPGCCQLIKVNCDWLGLILLLMIWCI